MKCIGEGVLIQRLLGTSLYSFQHTRNRRSFNVYPIIAPALYTPTVEGRAARKSVPSYLKILPLNRLGFRPTCLTSLSSHPRSNNNKSSSSSSIRLHEEQFNSNTTPTAFPACIADLNPQLCFPHNEKYNSASWHIFELKLLSRALAQQIAIIGSYIPSC